MGNGGSERERQGSFVIVRLGSSLQSCTRYIHFKVFINAVIWTGYGICDSLGALSKVLIFTPSLQNIWERALYRST